MNESLVYISGVLNPVAFALGAVLTIQVWRIKNPICLVFALLLLSYQTRNLITAITVPAYSVGLVRPTGLLIWSNVGRLIEACGTLTAILYFAGKAQLDTMMNYFLTSEELDATPRAPVSGELPPDWWQQEIRQAVRDVLKEFPR